MRQFLDRLSFLVLRLTLPVTIFLVPLFFLPNTPDFFTTNKQLLLNILASLALTAFAIRSITQGQIKITLGPALLPLLFLVVIYLLSSFIGQNNPFIPLLGRTSNIISLVLIYLTTTSTLTLTSHVRLTLFAFLVSLSLASLFTIYQFLGVSSHITDITWLQNKAFNLVGGPLPFLSLALPALFTALYLALKGNLSSFTRLLLYLASATIAIASILAVILLLPQNGVTNLLLLPYTAGWVIAVDIFKNLKTALIGTGPASFASVYSQLKPSFLNQTNLWNLRFSNSSNEYFHLLTTVGVLGLLSYLLATVRTTYLAFKKAKPNLYLTLTRTLLVLTLVIQLFIPTSLPLLTLTFVSLSLLTITLKTSSDLVSDAKLSFFAAEITKAKTQEDTTPQKARTTEILPYIFLALVALFLIPTWYFRVKAYAAETIFYSSLKSAAENKGIDTYNQQIKAISLYPQDPRYHISYSQTNLALANALASQPDLSDQDKANVTQLIQQAIREAKIATSLDPQDPSTWANLASIYRQLINLAQDADQWTIAAYTEAITRDPLNPALRVELGGVYYSLRNYDQAIRLFTQATEAKPDWPNAYYNLAAAYKEAQQYPQALQAMRIVVELLDPTSPDYQKAQDELKQLETLAANNQPAIDPDSEATPSGELALPSPIPSPSISPIELPDGSGLNIPDTSTNPEATPSAQ